MKSLRRVLFRTSSRVGRITTPRYIPYKTGGKAGSEPRHVEISFTLFGFIWYAYQNPCLRIPVNLLTLSEVMWRQFAHGVYRVSLT